MTELKRITQLSQAQAEHFAKHEAKPCPFCGCTELSIVDWCDDDGEYPAIECTEYLAAAPVEVWNRRA